MQSAWHIALSMALLSSLPAAVANAEEPAAGSAEQEAKQHFHIAQTHKELGEYDQAAEHFLKAYELYKDPAFFFNAGEMYRLHGDHKLAVKYFKMYLIQHPNGRVAAAAKSTILEIQPKAELQVAKEKLAEESARRKALEEEQAAAAALQDAETAGAARARKKAEAKARREIEAAEAKAKRDVEVAEAKARQAEEAAAAAKAASAKTQREAEAARRKHADSGAATLPDEDAGSWSVEKRLKVAGIATGGAGGVALGVGAYFGINSASNNSDLETLKADRKFNPHTIDDRDSSAMAFYVLTGVGAAALITGGVLYYLGDGASETSAEQTAFLLSPVVTTDGAAISCSGSF